MNQKSALTILFVVIICSVLISLCTSHQKAQVDAYLSEINTAKNEKARKTIQHLLEKNVNDTTLTHNEVSLTIPQDWNFGNLNASFSQPNQIACWEKEGQSSIAISWVEKELSPKEYLDITKLSLKEEVAFKGFHFSEDSTGEILNSKMFTCNLSGTQGGVAYKGKILTFNFKGKTFLISSGGYEEFYNSGEYEKILSSLKINHIEVTQNNSEVPDNWTVYEIENIGTIEIPPSMEIRDQNSYTALLADVATDHISNVKKIALKEPNLVFQAKGLNYLSTGATSKYSRIIINHIKGEPGEFHKRNEHFSSQEKAIKDAISKHEVLSSFEGFDVKLIKWSPWEIVNINNASWHKISYIRQMGNNPSIYLEDYRFDDDSEEIEITLSYRTTERSFWEKDFRRVANTLKIKK